jgi:hypothetical protein
MRLGSVASLKFAVFGERLDVVVEPGARQVDVDHLLDLAWPIGNHDDPVAQGDRLVDGVRDENDGLPGLGDEALELTLHRLARHRVDRRERLVGQQDIRLGDQRPGDADPLLHAAGQLVRVRLFEASQVDEVDVAPHPRVLLLFR